MDKKLQKILKTNSSAYQKLLRGAPLDQNTSLMNNFYEDLYEYCMDSGDMPYGVAKARTGDPYEWMENQLEKDGVFGESLDDARMEDSLKVVRRSFYGLEDANDYGLGNLVSNVRDDKELRKFAKASVALTKKLEKHLHKNYPDWEKRDG